jgi:S1-C subfamily serine protease
MTTVRTTKTSSLLFRFFTIPFLLLLVIALALDGLIAYAEPPIGSVLGSVLHPDLGFTPRTIIASIMASFGLESDHGVLALNVDPGERAAVGDLQNCDIMTTVDQHQNYNLEAFWHSLRQSGYQPTLQLTTQRKNAQSTIALQKPSLPKAGP